MARQTTTGQPQVIMSASPRPHTHAGTALRQLTMHISTNDLHCTLQPFQSIPRHPHAIMQTPHAVVGGRVGVGTRECGVMCGGRLETGGILSWLCGAQGAQFDVDSQPI
jgi:hypothetical protein